MRGHRHDATGRGSATPLAKFKPKDRPKEYGFTQFCWMPLRLLRVERKPSGSVLWTRLRRREKFSSMLPGQESVNST